MTAKSSQAFYIGLDLAWGETARTGIAVLTDSGALLSSACLITNDEIADFLSPLVGSHASVVAIDAPLVVPNETGQRECERHVAKLFGRYNAGAYPANRRNPLFAPEPRGARLATRFGWDLNPGSSSSAGHSVAIEVYPHPAMVALFGLSTVIPYKSKKGRNLESRRASFDLLLDHIERGCGEQLQLDLSERWDEIRAIVGSAKQQAQLERIEDEIDAIFCAHLAWMWDTQRSRMTILGDFETGYIVIPADPPIALPAVAAAVSRTCSSP